MLVNNYNYEARQKRTIVMDSTREGRPVKRPAGRSKDRKSDRQTDRQTNGQADRVNGDVEDEDSRAAIGFEERLMNDYYPSTTIPH